MKNRLKTVCKKIYTFLLNILFIRKRKIYVAGMRRSGNHAFINWLTNALEGETVRFRQPLNQGRFFVTSTGRTVLINEVNTTSPVQYTIILLKYLRFILRSENIIISTEDYLQRDNFKIPTCDYYFLVKRTVLSLIGSRYKKLSNGIKEGKGLSNFNVDDSFFVTLKKLYTSTNYIPWMYDEWLLSEEYRSNFLAQFNLSFDSIPEISTQGGGSSFSGNNLPDKDNLLQRYRQVEIPIKIVEKINDSEVSIFLTKTEKRYLAEEYRPK